MSQMPDKIWLHKDTKYSTGDIVSAYQYKFAQEIEDEGGIENFVEYVPVDAFIEKAVGWIETNMDDYIHVEYDTVTGKPTNEAHIAHKKVVEDFINYMI